ncbi:hypothetical protein AgCh_008557 [Apium graveolens]
MVHLTVDAKTTANGRPIQASLNTLNVVKAGKANELCGKESKTECKGQEKRVGENEEEARHVIENQDYIYTQSFP